MKNIDNLNFLLGNKSSVSEEFHKHTKIKRLIPPKTLLKKKIPKTWEKTYFKAYSRLDEIKLSNPKSIKKPLTRVLNKRLSIREYTTKPIPEQKISNLLFYSCGLRYFRPDSWESYRFYPSAGARFPLETYLITKNVQGIKPGLYHYYLKNHSLEKLLSINDFNSLEYFNQPWINKAAGIIILTAIFKRTTDKYGDRGYRHVLVEAGHLGQNIYLCASAMQIGCCAIGGYADDKINRLLDVDGIDESVIYAFSLGNFI